MRAPYAIVLAAVLALVFLAAAHADQYGFVSAPYNYADEYRQIEARCPLPWRPYLPGYHRCSGARQEKTRDAETK